MHVSACVGCVGAQARIVHLISDALSIGKFLESATFVMNAILDLSREDVQFVEVLEFLMLIIVKNVHKWKKIETDVQRLLI